MNVRRKTKHQPAGKWFVWLLVPLLTEIQIIINRVTKGLFQFVNTFPLKCNHIAQIHNLTVKKAGLFVKLNLSVISFIL